MSKICAKCEKSVYPLEELKCLDKVWHKACFRCAECGMLLNMKNYKGYAKIPYCVAHYPKTKATVVAETPEMTRLAQNTKFQSQVKYHEDFEKNIKGSKIEVTDDPETQRVMKVNALISQLEYKGKKEHSKSSPAPPLANKPKIVNKLATEKTSNGDKFSPFSSRCVTNSTVYSSDGSKVQAKKQPVKRIGSIADYDPVNENYGSLASGYKPASRQSSQVQDVVGNDDATFVAPIKLDIGDEEINHTIRNDEPEKVDDEKKREEADDVEEEKTDDKEKRQEVEDVVEESKKSDEEDVQQPVHVEHKENATTLVKPDIVDIADTLTDQVIGSVEDGLKEQLFTEKESTKEEVELEEAEAGPSEVATHLKPDVVPEEEGGHELANAVEIVGVDDGEGGEIITTPLPGLFIAMYDYDAQDDDEVSFVEDDVIEDVEKIDEGWLLGTVVRTGFRGMLPANYVAPHGAEEEEEE